ncbi:hypothetical protein NQZ68_034732 [Dissostichus eleginoides]|nr:hypothetical protein NQZ68_034732 [Dissostichus eleginoides]
MQLFVSVSVSARASGHPLTACPLRTARLRVCLQLLLTASGALKPRAKINSPRPIYAPASACTRDSTGPGLQRRTGHFYAPGMGTFTRREWTLCGARE